MYNYTCTCTMYMYMYNVHVHVCIHIIMCTCTFVQRRIKFLICHSQDNKLEFYSVHTCTCTCTFVHLCYFGYCNMYMYGYLSCNFMCLAQLPSGDTCINCTCKYTVWGLHLYTFQALFITHSYMYIVYACICLFNSLTIITMYMHMYQYMYIIMIMFTE